MVFLCAPTGWGKSRIVQEFYSGIASDQDYWPEEIIDQSALQTTGDLAHLRKRLRPPAFDVARKASPPWLWLAAETDESPTAVPEDAYYDLARQLEPHLAPVLRRRRLNTATIKLIVKSVMAFVPMVPSEIDAIASLGAEAKDIAREIWAERSSSGRRVGEVSTVESAASFWQLLSAVWGKDGSGGPPMVLVIEDAHYLSEPSVGLLRDLLASKLPVLVIATGWPSPDEWEGTRYAPLAQMLEGRLSRLRLEDLEILGESDLAAFVSQQHPGTSAAIAEVLVRRSGGNPYALRLMLARIAAKPGAAVTSDLSRLVAMDFKLKSQLTEMLLEEADDVRLALVSAALVGHRLPTEVADAAAILVPPASVRAALRSHWLRRPNPGIDVISFLEPLRHEVSLDEAALWLLPEQRQEILIAGLSEVRRLLTDELPDPDRALLCDLHLRLASECDEEDAALLLDSANELFDALWQQRAVVAARQVLGQTDSLMSDRVLARVPAAKWAIFKARAHRLLDLRASQSTVAAAADAMKLTEDLDTSNPGLRTLALLEDSRLHRDADLPSQYDVERSRSSFDAAQALMRDFALTDDRLIHEIRVCEYALTSAEGRRDLACDLALAESDRCRAEDGSATYESLVALDDAAFYAARFNDALGIELSERLITERISYWGTETHPIISKSRKDLAVRILRMTNDAEYDRGWLLATEALAATSRAYGPEENQVLNARSAVGLAHRKVGFSQWRQDGATDSVVGHWRRSLVEAEFVLDARLRHWPDKEALVSRERLAAAAAILGSDRGIADLLDCLRLRHEVRHQPSGQAEVTWLARDLWECLLVLGRDAEARAIREEYGLPEN